MESKSDGSSDSAGTQNQNSASGKRGVFLANSQTIPQAFQSRHTIGIEPHRTLASEYDGVGCFDPGGKIIQCANMLENGFFVGQSDTQTDEV